MTNKWIFLLLLTVVVSAVPSFGRALAAESDYPPEVEEIEDSPMTSDTSNADDWFMKPSDKAMGDGTGQRSSSADGKKKDRYVWLFEADAFQYYLDTESVKWIRLPYSSSEYIADVWVRLSTIENSELSFDGEGFAAPKYFMEHYYLRPQTKQVQFLCELEVTGRPQNTISEREYSVKNWENLIPGSIEDEIYRTVLKYIGQGKSRDSGHMTFADMLDEYLRIGLN